MCRSRWNAVSILVLLDLCIKTRLSHSAHSHNPCFNPCFIGSMYKNQCWRIQSFAVRDGFNPCFIGSMYKNLAYLASLSGQVFCFNPCFIGSMYKNLHWSPLVCQTPLVSILVLLDLCIKTNRTYQIDREILPVSILVLLDLCIKTITIIFIINIIQSVSILVLLDLCIKTRVRLFIYWVASCFNPCFIGSMYKNEYEILLIFYLW